MRDKKSTRTYSTEKTSKEVNRTLNKTPSPHTPDNSQNITMEKEDILNNINDLENKDNGEEKEGDSSCDDIGFMVPANPHKDLRDAARPKMGINFSLNKSEHGKKCFENFDFSVVINIIIDSEVTDNPDVSSQNDD